MIKGNTHLTQTEKNVSAMVCCLMPFVLALLAGCASSEEAPAEKSEARVNGSIPKRVESERAFAMWTNVEVRGQNISTRVYFLDEWALVDLDTNDEDRIAIYNLKNHSWYNPRTGYVALAAARQWAEESEKVSRESMEKSDSSPEVKRLLMETLEPNFKVTPSEGGLRLENAAFVYELSGPADITARQLEHVFAFAKLHAYYKSMTDRKLSPNVELALFEELERRAFLPTRTRLTVHNPDVTLAIKMRTEIRPLNERDLTRIEGRIAAWRNKFPKSVSQDSPGR